MRVVFISLIILTLTISCSKEDKQVLAIEHYTYDDNEIDLFNKINHFRDSIGIGQVTLVEHVSYKCMEHNQYMMDNNLVNHDFFYDRSTNIENVCGATKVAEILAYNYQTNKSALMAWLNSPCHDTIVRSEFLRIGVSIRENPINNRKYYTVIFLN
jgi:uncharacterized protein YkwD